MIYTSSKTKYRSNTFYSSLIRLYYSVIVYIIFVGRIKFFTNKITVHDILMLVQFKYWQ